MKVKLVPVYRSRAEEYRIRMLRKRIARGGKTMLDCLLAAAMVGGIAGVLIAGMALDNVDQVEPALAVIAISAAAAVLGAVGTEKMKEG